MIQQNKIIYQDNLVTTFLMENKKYGNKEVVIDTKNWNKVKKYRWYLMPRRDKTGKFYIYSIKFLKIAKCNYSRETIYLHRLILGLKKRLIEGDHKSGDTLDNREDNLRESTRIQNGQNQVVERANNKSGYKGVSWSKGMNKWHANICLPNKKIISLGFYEYKKCAARVYNKAAIKYFGEFARLN